MLTFDCNDKMLHEIISKGNEKHCSKHQCHDLNMSLNLTIGK